MKVEMKIAKVNGISLGDKDMIDIKDFESFKKIHQEYFSSAVIFDCQGVYYMIGSEAAYTYKYKKGEI